MIFTNGEVSIFFGDRSKKAQTIFSSSYNQCPNRSPVEEAMNKLEVAGRLIQWVVELSKFDVQYKLRELIKAQVLVDFTTEFTPANNQQDGDPGAKQWVVHVDGLSTQHAGGIGIILQSLEGDCLEYIVRLQFETTNNEAKYEALLQGFELAKSFEAESVLVQGDS